MTRYEVGLTAGSAIGSRDTPRRLDLVVEAHDENHASEQVMAAWYTRFGERPMNLLGGITRT
jgi:hypothetical protein